MKQKNTIKIACVYTGAILGAGFASGKELTQYFMNYGQVGFLGIILSGIMFGIVGWAILDITYINHIECYQQFSNIVFGKVFGSIMEWISVLFMFILFSTMLAASGAIAEQTEFLQPKFAIIVLTLICLITFMFDMKGIIIINAIISPILLIGGILLGLYAFFEKAIPTGLFIFSFKRNWIISSFVYVAYNIITSVSVLASMGKMIDSKKTAKYSGLIGGLILCIIGICLSLGIIVNYNEVFDLQLPVLKLAQKYGITIESLYILLLILAIYTTATINGYSAINWAVQKFKVNKLLFTLLFVVTGFIVGQLKFSNFIAVIYPIFGYIGLFEILVILINFYTQKK